MMFKVLGVEQVTGNFKGNDYSGRAVYAQFPDNYKSDRLTGVKVERIWISDRLQCPSFAPGDMIEVFYNRFGRVDNVQIV